MRALFIILSTMSFHFAIANSNPVLKIVGDVILRDVFVPENHELRGEGEMILLADVQDHESRTYRTRLLFHPGTSRQATEYFYEIPLPKFQTDFEGRGFSHKKFSFVSDIGVDDVEFSFNRPKDGQVEVKTPNQTIIYERAVGDLSNIAVRQPWHRYRSLLQTFRSFVKASEPAEYVNVDNYLDPESTSSYKFIAFDLKNGDHFSAENQPSQKIQHGYLFAVKSEDLDSSFVTPDKVKLIVLERGNVRSLSGHLTLENDNGAYREVLEFDINGEKVAFRFSDIQRNFSKTYAFQIHGRHHVLGDRSEYFLTTYWVDGHSHNKRTGMISPLSYTDTSSFKKLLKLRDPHAIIMTHPITKRISNKSSIACEALSSSP